MSITAALGAIFVIALVVWWIRLRMDRGGDTPSTGNYGGGESGGEGGQSGQVTGGDGHGGADAGGDGGGGF